MEYLIDHMFLAKDQEFNQGYVLLFDLLLLADFVRLEKPQFKEELIPASDRASSEQAGQLKQILVKILLSDVRDRLARRAIDLVADLAMIELLSNRNFDVADITGCNVWIFIVIGVFLRQD